MAKWIMRVLGSLNILFGLIGICYFAIRLTGHLKKAEVAYSTGSWVIFSLLSLFALSMVLLLVYLGIRLITADSSILGSTAIIFAAEVLYFFLDMVIFWEITPSSMAQLTIGFWELPTCLIAPQILTAYPLIGIIICIVLSRKCTPVANSTLV
jgi:hypothetical protein